MKARQAKTVRKTKQSAIKQEAPTNGVVSHQWTFLSNHAHVLICLADDPHVLLREVAARIGVTERAVQGIVKDLEEEGLIERHREGRRNSYVLNLEQPLRHPIEAHRTVRELVDLCSKTISSRKRRKK